MKSKRQTADNGSVTHLHLAEEALARYALEGATLTLISDVSTALYKVTVPADAAAIYHPYLGRINGMRLLLRIEDAADYHIASTYSELVLLATLLRDTDLTLPEPVPTASGELVSELWLEGMTRPQQCVLFRWAGMPFPERALERMARWQSN